MTFIVQSSSVFTSAITPLVGQYNIYVFVFIVKVWHYLLTLMFLQTYMTWFHLWNTKTELSETLYLKVSLLYVMHRYA